MTIKENHSKKNTPIVFLPGYLGSELYTIENKIQKKLFLDIETILGFKNPNLTLKENDGIFSGNVMVRIPVLDHLLNVEIYGSLLKTLERYKNFDFHLFHYDWRKSNSIHTKSLIEFINSIEMYYNKPIVLIAHSNGGLIALSAINQTEKVSHLIVAGSPFRGGIGFLEDLMIGNPIGFNKTILSPIVVSSFESPFHFFPSRKFSDTDSVVNTREDGFIEDDFFSIDFWKFYNLGPFNNNLIYKRDEIHLEQKLLSALDFKSTYQFNPLKKYPLIININSSNYPTKRSITGTKKNSRWYWDIEKSNIGKGDGRVTSDASELPKGYVSKNIISTQNHMNLLNDESMLNDLFNDL
jgi:hypothetical protein